MLRYLRLLFVAVTALTLLFLALANRDPVTVRLLPQDLSMMLNTEGAWSMPLFLVSFGAIAVGVVIGFVWEWFREMRLRGEAKQKTREVTRLERELAVLKDANSIPPQDEVLAILGEGARK